MNESGSLVRLVIAFGLFFIFVGFLPGQQTPQAWVDFQDHVEGREFPQFYSPFPSEYLRVEVNAVNYSVQAPTHSVGTNCDVGGFFSNYDARTCVQPPEATSQDSWVNTTLDGFDATPAPGTWLATTVMNLPMLNGGEGGTPVVTTVVVHVVCRSDKRVFVNVTISGFSDAGTSSPGYCGVGILSDAAAVWTGRFTNTWTALDGGAININFGIGVDNGGDGLGFVEVSYLQADIYTEAQEDCSAPSGAWFPWVDESACAIGRGIETIWRGILFVVQAGIYVVQIVAYILTTLVLLVLGFFEMLAFLFALPGAPTIAQAIVDVFVVSVAVFIIYTLIRMVRGPGGGP